MERDALSVAADVATVVTPIVIGAGFWFASRQWLSTRNARMSEAVQALIGQWDSDRMARSRLKVRQLSGSLLEEWERADKEHDIESYTNLTRVGDFFDALGVQVCEGFLECKIAYELFHEAEEVYYQLYQPFMKSEKHKGYLRYFQMLHNEFLEENAQRSKTKTKCAP